MKTKAIIAGLSLFIALGATSLIAQGGNIVATGMLHGAAHHTSRRATVYKTADGQLLRITHFKTSNEPNVHVLLIAATDAKDDENFLNEKIERVDLGSLKGNEGDQSYPIPAGIVVAGLWYAFRPEKLFINKRVNEAAPAQTQGALTPIYTGRFVGEAHKTNGRATIYKQSDGARILQLTDFSTSNGPQLHVLLVDGQNPEASRGFNLAAVKNVDLGELKGNQGNQTYRIPADADLQTFSTVTVYCERFHANFGSAALQEF